MLSDSALSEFALESRSLRALGMGDASVHRWRRSDATGAAAALPGGLRRRGESGSGDRGLHRRIGPGQLGFFRDDAGGDRPASLPSLDAAEDLSLRLPQPHSVEPAAGTRSAAQCRIDVADRAVGTRLQDDCRLSQGQRHGDPGGVRPVRRAVPSAQTLHSCRCCDRRQQVQSGEQPRQELYGGQGHRADGAGRRPASRVTCGHWTGPTAKRAISPRPSRSG